MPETVVCFTHSLHHTSKLSSGNTYCSLLPKLIRSAYGHIQSASKCRIGLLRMACRAAAMSMAPCHLSSGPDYSSLARLTISREDQRSLLSGINSLRHEIKSVDGLPAENTSRDSNYLSSNDLMTRRYSDLGAASQSRRERCRALLGCFEKTMYR